MARQASAAMTLHAYAGLFGDDLDAVADLLDEAARRAAADPVRTALDERFGGGPPVPPGLVV